MANKPSLTAGFDLPFQEQIDFFRAKLNLPTEAWDDIWQAAHDRAFVVAGAMKADLLDDLRKAVDKAISTGTTLETFRKDFTEIVGRRGWQGWTGEGSPEGFAWRTKVIYETNLRTSYAAGRYAQLNDPGLKTLLPFWRYVHNDSVANPRPQHKRWGDMKLTLPSDHPFWRTHYPPNGWGCRCRVTAVPAPRQGDATEPPDGWNEISEKTGAPVGIDKGWSYAPGASLQDLKRVVATKVKTLPKPLADALQKDVAPILAAPKTLDEFITVGRNRRESLPDASIDPEGFQSALLSSLAAVGISAPAKLATSGAAAKTVREASTRFPDSWTARADTVGKLSVRSAGKSRAWAYTADRHGAVRLHGFGVVNVAPGDGFISVRPGDLSVAVHEFAHRIQAALPQLDNFFQDMHKRRTAGDTLRSLARLTGHGYGANELTREDNYVDPYWGKEYPARGALEVMAMAFQSLLGGDWNMLKMVYTHDKEVVDLALGLLHHWKP